ncbi:zinc finger MYM-type protein 1-like [Hydra vulgaris]|uniref:zinc finger MYM-type protein 1-like n=1 Tax=Hydra vulgaris TaxID=6087 RepID=UPI0032EA435D
MMIHSKKLSGAENRKRTHAKNEAQAKILLKTAKLETYFSFTDKQLHTSPVENVNNTSDENDHSFIVNENNLSNPDDLILILSSKSCIETSKTLLTPESKELNETPCLSMHEHNKPECLLNQNDHRFTVNKDNLTNPDNLILLNNSSTETSKTLLSTESEEINDTPRLPMVEHNSLPKQSIVPENDPANWIKNQETIDYLSINGFNQNLENNNFQKSKRIYTQIIGGVRRTRFRYMSKSIFISTLVNGEKINRTFLIYSESKRSIFCAPCYLFGGTTLFATVGFSDWKKGEEKIKRHENSQHHKLCVMNMKERKEVLNRVDQKLKYQVETEINYWKNVLIRVVAVVKSLSSRGMSFRGDDDRFGSVHNGNFMMSLELIAQFDPFLAQHIEKFGNKGKGSTSYLSFNIYEQFISIMADNVIQQMVKEIKEAKYFSISIDSTPDISHADQLSFIFRYVQKNGCPVERFLGFLPNSGHKSEELADAVFLVLESHGLDINNCRGQSYDNASNMSGRYTGLQARIKKVNPLATFVPCSAHSLNLVGECAVDCCIYASEFFILLQNIYKFFSASTYRWEILQKNLIKTENVSLKKLSDTRWSARSDASISLNKNWIEIINALSFIKDDKTEKSITRSEANGLYLKLDSLETAIMATLWGDILERFNKTSKQLQSVEIDLETVVSLYESLIRYVLDLRNEKREEETNFKIRDSLRINTYYAIIDKLHSELERRKLCYDKANKKFNFLFQIIKLSPSEVYKKAEVFQNVYKNDLSSSFANECIQFRSYLMSLTENLRPKTIIDVYKMIKTEKLQELFPYVDIALRIYLCSPTSNCSAERSFSALKRVKSYLRSRMTSDRLNRLAILSIESVLTIDMNFNDIINTFAKQNAHRKL